MSIRPIGMSTSSPAPVSANFPDDVAAASRRLRISLVPYQHVCVRHGTQIAVRKYALTANEYATIIHLQKSKDDTSEFELELGDNMILERWRVQYSTYGKNAALGAGLRIVSNIPISTAAKMQLHQASEAGSGLELTENPVNLLTFSKCLVLN